MNILLAALLVLITQPYLGTGVAMTTTFVSDGEYCEVLAKQFREANGSHSAYCLDYWKKAK